VFDTVREAAREPPAPTRRDLRAAAVRRRRDHRGGDAGIELVVAITEGIPVLDMVRVRSVPARAGRG
jgi:succinyl-CoA synthetase alpha subunit